MKLLIFDIISPIDSGFRSKSEEESEKANYFSELDSNPDILPDKLIEDPDETAKERKARIKEEKRLEKEQKKEMKTKQTQLKKEAKLSKKNTNETRFFRKKSSLKKKIPKYMQDENAIYDRAVEMYLKDKFKLFEYQSVNPLLLKKDNLNQDSDEESQIYEIEPDERSQLTKENFDHPESSGQTFSKMQGWNGNMYVPPAFKNSYQLSIWKIGEFGTVKILNKYFTPKYKNATEMKFPGFVLQLSLDEQTMLMIEKDQAKQKEFITITFDIYSLEILSETLVSTVDESIREEEYYQGKSSEFNVNYAGPFQAGDQVPKVTSWYFGSFILAGVSTHCNSKIIYKYRIYSTKTSSLVSTIVRASNELLTRKIVSLSYVEENEDVLHWATVEKKDIVMLEVNMISGLAVEIARYSGFTPIYAFPTEDQSSIYLIHQDSNTKAHHLYCTRYLFEGEKHEDDKSEESDGKCKV